MGRRAASEPTDVELEILQVLWEEGPSGVQHVFRVLAKRRTVAYSTVLTMMQVMKRKGLLIRDDSVRPQIYRPAAKREKTQLHMLDRLLKKVFGGSAKAMVMRAVSAGRIKADELEEMQRLVREAKKGGKGE